MSEKKIPPFELGSPHNSPDLLSLLGWLSESPSSSLKAPTLEGLPVNENPLEFGDFISNNELAAVPTLERSNDVDSWTINPQDVSAQAPAAQEFDFSTLPSFDFTSISTNPLQDFPWAMQYSNMPDLSHLNGQTGTRTGSEFINPLDFYPAGPFCFATRQPSQSTTNPVTLSQPSKSLRVNTDVGHVRQYHPHDDPYKFSKTKIKGQTGFHGEQTPLSRTGEYVDLPQNSHSPSFSTEAPSSPERGNAKLQTSSLQYAAEKPRADSEHSWLRINGCTQGKSSRTGKINSYSPRRDGKYRETKHPIGNWTTPSGFELNYTRNGELRKLTFTPKEMKQFLWNHPLANQNENGHLTLWIQKTPADSGRRYPTVGSSKCRFRDCPAQVFSRSIGVGLFRVAIDEQWETYHGEKDPFHVAGYVHLYCLERFCDFRAICQNLNIRADNREYMAGEPRQKFSPALSKAQHKIATDLIETCVAGAMKLRYPDYPAHNDRTPTIAKRHKATLTYMLTVEKNRSTNNSKKLMMQKRGLKQSNILIHKGDLQMAIDAREKENAIRRKALLDARDAQSFNEEDLSSAESEEEYVKRPTRRTRAAAATTPTADLQYQDSIERSNALRESQPRKRVISTSNYHRETPISGSIDRMSKRRRIESPCTTTDVDTSAYQPLPAISIHEEIPVDPELVNVNNNRGEKRQMPVFF